MVGTLLSSVPVIVIYLLTEIKLKTVLEGYVHSIYLVLNIIRMKANSIYSYKLELSKVMPM